MSRLKRTKLQNLLGSWPSGTVHTSHWQRIKGYSKGLLHRYRKSGWIYPIGSGGFGRVGDQVTWEGAVYALQQELGLSIHPGGATALFLQGASHFVPLGSPQLGLYGERDERLSAWFRGHDWGAKVVYRPTSLFAKEPELGMTKYEQGGFSIRISCRERAMLELLHLVPRDETFEHARLLMEGLINLRPALVQKLLLACNSIKAKRLFMILAEGFEMPWLSRVNTDRIDFGRARRALYKGGKTHPKYLLGVPENYFSEA